VNAGCYGGRQRSYEQIEARACNLRTCVALLVKIRADDRASSRKPTFGVNIDGTALVYRSASGYSPTVAWLGERGAGAMEERNRQPTVLGGHTLKIIPRNASSATNTLDLSQLVDAYFSLHMKLKPPLT
jgi:hypothetical protein